MSLSLSLETDYQFTLVISVLLNTLRTQLLMEGIEASIPHVHPHEAILSPRARRQGHQHSPTHCACAPPCSSPISFASQPIRGKTEALLDAFGPGARALRMAVWSTHACNVECVGEQGSATIRPCRAFMHLGSIVTVQTNMSPEVRARSSAANCALGTTRAPVLSAQNIEQLTKNAALSSFVLSRFFYLTPTWPKLKRTQMRNTQGNYRNLAAPHRCSPKSPSPPCRSRWLRLASCTFPDSCKLLPLPYSFFWVRIVHGVRCSVTTVFLCGSKRHSLAKLSLIPVVRCSCPCATLLPGLLPAGNTLGAIPRSAGCMEQSAPSTYGMSLTCRLTATSALLRLWFVFCLSSRADGSLYCCACRG